MEISTNTTRSTNWFQYFGTNGIQNQPVVTTSKTYKITVGEGKNKIVFILEDGNLVKTPEDFKKLEKMHELILKLNSFIPSNPVQTFYLIRRAGKSITTPDGRYYRSGKYDRSDLTKKYDRHEIQLTFDNPGILLVTAHEMGHAISNTKIGFKESGETEDNDFQNIFYMCLGYNSYLLVSQHTYDGQYSGWAFNDPDELAACSIAAYVKEADRFINMILDPSVSDEAKRFGKLVFCYMRDKIFNGKTFCKNDPFKGDDFDTLRNSITREEIIKSLVSAIGGQGSNPFKINVIIDNRTLLRIKSDVTVEAVKGLLRIKSEEEVAPLINYLTNEKNRGREMIIEVISQLGIKDKRFVQPLINASNDKNIDVRTAAKNAIKVLGINISNKSYMK